MTGTERSERAMGAMPGTVALYVESTPREKKAPTPDPPAGSSIVRATWMSHGASVGSQPP